MILTIEIEGFSIGEEQAVIIVAHIVGPQTAVLPVIDHAQQLTRRPPLRVHILSIDQRLHQPDLIVGVEDGEIRLEPGEFGMFAQQPRADRMEGSNPPAVMHARHDRGDAFAHFARRLIGESDGEDVARPRSAGDDQMRDPRRQNARLARAGPGEDEQWAFQRLDRLALPRIEAVEIGGGRRARGGRCESCCVRRHEIKLIRPSGVNQKTKRG